MSRQRPWGRWEGGHLITICATFIHPSSRAYRLQARVHLFIVALPLPLPQVDISRLERLIWSGDVAHTQESETGH